MYGILLAFHRHFLFLKIVFYLDYRENGDCTLFLGNRSTTRPLIHSSWLDSSLLLVFTNLFGIVWNGMREKLIMCINFEVH